MTVLVALEASDPAWRALEHALSEHVGAGGGAGEGAGSPALAVVHVVDPAESGYGEVAHLGPEGIIEAKREETEALFDRARELAPGDVALRTETLIGRPADRIVDYAADDANGIDHVIVGSHGRTGLSRVLLGSVAERIARRAPVPVTIVR